MTETLDIDIVRTWRQPARIHRDDSGDVYAADHVDDGRIGTVEIRFSQFGRWYEIDSFFEGRFMERTQMGAFAKTIAESRDRVKSLFNHGFDFSVGDKVLGPIDSLREEPDSPVGDVGLLDTSYNRDLEPGLRAGLYGSSHTFRVVKDTWVRDPGKGAHNPQGLPERTLTEINLLEFGPVTWPANPGATAKSRCVSGTDRFYAALAQRDPDRVNEVRSRVPNLRTSPDRPLMVPVNVVFSADKNTGGAGPEAASDEAPEPVDNHSGVSLSAIRLRRLREITLSRFPTSQKDEKCQN